MTAPAPSVRHEFAREVGQANELMNLARAALLVAKEEYPGLSVEPYLLRLDAMAEEVRDRLAGETAPPIVLSEVIEVLFQRHGLRGNRERYYDPRNSFLNDVMDRGVGIPLTLGILVLEVGWRVGLEVEGVNFPRHFLVRAPGQAKDLLVDPFRNGKIRFPDEAQELLDQHFGGGVRLQPTHLNRASKRDMIVRLLLNLKAIYRKSGDDARALAAVERILVIHPTSPSEIRDRGYLLARLGRNDEAVVQLKTYLTFVPSAGDADDVEALVREIRDSSDPLDDGS